MNINKIIKVSLSLIFLLALTMKINFDNFSCANPNPLLNEETNLTTSGSIKYQKYSGFYKPLQKFIDISIVDIDLNDPEIEVKPVISNSLETVHNFATQNNAIAAINGGFFDYSNGLSVSNVKIDGKIVADPKINKNLTKNPQIKPFLKDIYNRNEFKILRCEGKTVYKIDKNSVIYKGCRTFHSLGGGPKLLPDMNLEKEAFLVYKNGNKIRESANVSNQDARMAIGLTPNNHLILIIASAGFYKDSYYGLTIQELSKFLKSFNLSSALAFDGGASTTMFLKMPDGKNKLILGDVNNKGDRIQPKVKTALIISLRGQSEK